MAKKQKKNKKRHLLVCKIISFIFIITNVIMNALFIYNETFSSGMLVLIGIISIILSLFFTVVLNNPKLRRWIKVITGFLSIVIVLFEILFMIYGVNTISFLKNLTDTGERIEEIGIYVLNDSNYKTINDLDGKTLNYLNDGDDTNVRKALKKFEEKIKFESDYVDDMEELLNKLSEQKVDAIVLSTSYEDIIKEEYKDIYEKMVMIYSESIANVVKVLKSDADITKDPFVVYISGIDTKGKIASKARSDVNILLAVNPTTGKILTVNTPRDFYVTFHTKGVKDKLTHAGVFGVEESLMTLEDFYDINIDYYVRINFDSFETIVNKLGGVTVNVEGSFCESNKDRSKKNKICLSKGTQTLNGEQALAYARNRHSFSGGDRARGEHQMQIIEAIINKAMSPKILSSYGSLISSLNDQVRTNMTSDEMIKFAKKQGSKATSWDFSSLSVTGKNSSNRCYAVGAGKAYVMEPDMSTVEVAKASLKNLLSGKKTIIETTTTTSTSTTKKNK